MRKVFFLLPAYNEEESIVPVIAGILNDSGLKKTFIKIIICDDGSTDATAEVTRRLIAEGSPIELIQHKMNRGLGETVRDLLETAADQADDDDLIIRLDCDATHEARFVGDMLKKIDAGADVVIASRFVEGGGQVGVVGFRAILSRLATLFMRLFFRIPGISEYTCGYRCYRASLIKKAIRAYGNELIQLKGLGFVCTLEKLVKLALLDAKFAEVPFVLRYDKKMSSSKMVANVTTLGYLVLVLLYYWPFGGWIFRRDELIRRITDNQVG